MPQLTPPRGRSSWRYSVPAAIGVTLLGGLVLLDAGRGGVKESAKHAAAVVASSNLAQSKKETAAPPAPNLQGQDRLEIERLLNLTRGQPEIGQRMKMISAQLLGRPYLRNPLIGSPTEPEQLVTRMDSFDCVTFLETVLALGHADSVDDFLERLRRIRYEGGSVDYKTRLHYMTDWNESNVRRGVLQNLTEGAGTVEQARTLSVVTGFDPRSVSFRCFPKSQLGVVGKGLQDGDLIYFVSARKDLDVFHVGLVFLAGERVLLRHASLSRNKVIDQNLVDFARVDRMLGFIVARPLESRIELKLHVPQTPGPARREHG